MTLPSPHPTGALVVVVDDEPRMRRFVAETLERAAYRVLQAPDAEQGMNLVFDRRPDLLVLDVMMPGLSGLEALRQIRANGNEIGIIMLTGLDDESDKVAALEGGADDYLTKPFAARELVARAKAILRRVRQDDGDAMPTSTGALSLVADTRGVRVEGREIPLTSVEYKLLSTLLKARGRVHTPSELASRVWGAGYADASDLVRTNIYRLRKKQEADAKNPRYLRSRPGVGYFISTETDSALM